jgi:hypothetical protein
MQNEESSSFYHSMDVFYGQLIAQPLAGTDELGRVLLQHETVGDPKPATGRYFLLAVAFPCTLERIGQ